MYIKALVLLANTITGIDYLTGRPSSTQVENFATANAEYDSTGNIVRSNAGIQNQANAFTIRIGRRFYNKQKWLVMNIKNEWVLYSIQQDTPAQARGQVNLQCVEQVNPTALQAILADWQSKGGSV